MQKENVSPQYVCEKFSAKNIIKRRVIRFDDKSGNRVYGDLDTGRLYRSLTSTIDAYAPSKKYLEYWRNSMAENLGGMNNVKRYVEATADYGTALHVLVAMACQYGFVDWEVARTQAVAFLSSESKFGSINEKAADDLMCDLAAIMQFFADYNVTPLVCEFPVFSEMGYATLIDLLVEMDEKNYVKTEPVKRKRVLALLNIKSGRTSSSSGHALQLVGELQAFNETYSQIFENVLVGTISPKEWTGELPTYTLSILKPEAFVKAKFVFDATIELARADGFFDFSNKKARRFEGVTKLGQSVCTNIKIDNYFNF